jgi:probable F420-dependent oxidoreductase
MREQRLRHIGLKIPNWGPTASADSVSGVARVAEARGFASLWVSDHVAMPSAPMLDYAYGDSARPPFDASTPFLDPFVTLAFVAACTERVQLATGVFVLPLRHPLIVAKQVASLDVLAGGRTVLGIGSGWLRDEFTLLGQSWTDRGRRTDEAIATLRACWHPGPAQLSDGTVIGIAPAPPQQDSLPILVGGHSAAAMRRAASLGDGWYASNVTVPEFAELVGRLREAEGRVGREDLLVGVRPGVVDPADAARIVEELVGHGADFVVLDAPFGDLSDEAALDWVERTADALGLDGTPGPRLAGRRVTDGVGATR